GRQSAPAKGAGWYCPCSRIDKSKSAKSDAKEAFTAGGKVIFTKCEETLQFALTEFRAPHMFRPPSLTAISKSPITSSRQRDPSTNQSPNTTETIEDTPVLQWRHGCRPAGSVTGFC